MVHVVTVQSCVSQAAEEEEAAEQLLLVQRSAGTKAQGGFQPWRDTRQDPSAGSREDDGRSQAFALRPRVRQSVFISP